MRKEKGNLRVKGFTLIELIVVIAIIGILAGILAPTMSTYYRKARIKDANSDAKMVYNAAQTAAQTFINMDRVTSGTSSGLDGTLIISYNAADGSVTAGSAFGSLAPDNVDANVQYIVNSVNRTVAGAERVCWAVCIENYIVKGSISANSAGTDRVGYYSANKTQASDVTHNNYSQWINGTPDPGTEVDCLQEVCDSY